MERATDLAAVYVYRNGLEGGGVTATGGEGTGVRGHAGGVLKNKDWLTFMTKGLEIVRRCMREFLFVCLGENLRSLFFSFHLFPPSTPPPSTPNLLLFLPQTHLWPETQGFAPAQVQNTPSLIHPSRCSLLLSLSVSKLHPFFYPFLSCYSFPSCWTLLLFCSHVLCSSLALFSPQARH